MSGYVPNPPKGYRNSGVDPVDINAQHWAQYKDLPPTPDTKPTPMGCVFAKSCNLPDGEINHTNPAGFVPVEKLADYGLWAVLATGAAITAEGTALQFVGGSTSGSAIAQRLGGSLALGLLEGARTLAAGAAVGTVALLMPDTSLTPDSAFYKTDQYATLETGRTRVRVNVKTLPDGSVNAYGYYTGGKKDWENVPVIKAEKSGEKYIADIGNGIGLTWTPAANPDAILGIPALEGAPRLPPVWVYPPTAQSDTLLANPAHPPEFHDAIIWFPDDAGLEPIYIVLSTQLEKNKAAGAAFEEEAYGGFSEEMEESGQQITIKTESGTRTRLDMIGRCKRRHCVRRMQSLRNGATDPQSKAGIPGTRTDRWAHHGQGQTRLPRRQPNPAHSSRNPAAAAEITEPRN